jgi:hypothetical protein
MTQVPLKAPAPPQGVIASLVTGFETVNARLELILPPLALDLFLWLGPHLSIQRLVPPLVRSLESVLLPPNVEGVARQNSELIIQVVEQLGNSFNAFSLLSTAPLGLPSLLAGRAASGSPVGVPLVWHVDSLGQYFLVVGAFLLVGLLLGAFYFGGIAQQVRDKQINWKRLLQQVWGDWARLTALGALVVAVCLVMAVPITLLSAIVMVLSPALGTLVSTGGVTLLLWLFFYGGFALHSMMLQRRGLFGALWDSIRLVQFNLPYAAGLFVVVVLINFGLSLVWNIPQDNSWLLLLGVAGHALISTALVTATFVFFQDRYRWWMEVRRGLAARAEAEKRGLRPKV